MKIKANANTMDVSVEFDIEQLCKDNTGYTLDELIDEVINETDEMEGNLLVAYNQAFRKDNEDDCTDEEWENYCSTKRNYLKPILKELLEELFTPESI